MRIYGGEYLNGFASRQPTLEQRIKSNKVVLAYIAERAGLDPDLIKTLYDGLIKKGYDTLMAYDKTIESMQHIK